MMGGWVGWMDGWMDGFMYTHTTSPPLLLRQLVGAQVCARQAKRAQQLEEALSVTPAPRHMHSMGPMYPHVDSNEMGFS